MAVRPLELMRCSEGVQDDSRLGTTLSVRVFQMEDDHSEEWSFRVAPFQRRYQRVLDLPAP